MIITPYAKKQLLRMDRRYAQRLVKALQQHELDGSGDVKKLQGREGYRIRVGGYRAIFDFEGEEVVVLEAASRGDVYK